MEQRHGQLLQNHCCPDLMPLRAVQVLRNADGGGGCQLFPKKALQRYKGVTLLALRGGVENIMDG